MEFNYNNLIWTCAFTRLKSRMESKFQYWFVKLPLFKMFEHTNTDITPELCSILIFK